jgi:BirA family biotin operon repressor/biotin-[acetyl-CoA-carboxylase] ligase
LFRLPVLPELPFLVLAADQTAGRGRGTKNWWTGRGSLAMSIGMKLSETSLERSDLTNFSQEVGRIVAELVAARIPSELRTEVHPPNDVYVDGKKIAGILLESPTPKQLVVGIGLNVNNRFADAPQEFRNLPITTLYDILREELDLTEIVIDLLQRLLANENFPPVQRVVFN